MIGQTISHYKILEKLGEGGMGVVYKAEDTTLDRFVALKFLPPSLHAGDQEKARFIQEAKAAAALNHPNICSVIAIQEADGQMFIVMEYVDGQTLRDKRGQISFKQAIDIGIQIADGLAAAHEKGIVHRDIKPENIMIRKDGIAQIMDFGLAKLRSASSKVNRLTREGSTVGTAGYMSPEQIQGQDVDHRSDIFSFGVLLYELLTGQLPFKGVHETALAYEIVNVDAAPLSSVKPEIDANLDAIVLDCLEKDPKERCQSVAEVARDLRRVKRESTRQRHSRITAARPAMSSSAFQPPSSSPAPEAAGMPAHEMPARPTKLPWILAAVLLLGMLAFVLLYFRSGGTVRQTVRSSILPPDKLQFAAASSGAGEGHIALSPDGRSLAFVGADSLGKTHLMVRSLSAFSAKELPSTEGAYYPFWSPDNRFIGFFQNGKLKKIEAAGGPSVTICDAPDARGGTWNQEGQIVFAANAYAPLSLVPATGGTAQQLTVLDSNLHQRTHRWPSFLPDGKHFLYFGRSSFGGVEREEDGLYVGSLDGKVTKRLSVGKSNGEYANGHLLYLREKTLMAQPFDPGKMEVTGDATPIAEAVEYDLSYNRAVFTCSATGTVAYQPSTPHGGQVLEWFDRKGASLGTIGDEADYADAVISPDGKSLAFDLYDPQSRNRDIWLYELSRGLRTRFTFDPNVDEVPIWSPDGSRIYFHSDRKGRYDLYEKITSGAGTEQVLLLSDLQKIPQSCSSDGKYLAYAVIDPKSEFDIWILPLGEGQKPFVYLQTPFNEAGPVFSPDVRWIAYESDESGGYELYVRPFRGSADTLGSMSGKWQISTNGINSNTYPRWSPDGKQLYYQAGNNKLISVDISTQGSNFSIGSAHELFEFKPKGLMLFQDVTSDGQRFLFIDGVGGESTGSVSLITNWDAELK